MCILVLYITKYTNILTFEINLGNKEQNENILAVRIYVS